VKIHSALLLSCLCLFAVARAAESPPIARRTTLTISGDSFLINGEPTFKGRTWRGHRIEGLLPNARLVQGIFDDTNPATNAQWAYPDTGKWDADRNTREFVAAMPAWRQRGLLGITLNLQGGSPLGYGNKGWINTAFAADGSLKPAYFQRLELILNRADELGMIVILGLFYFGQAQNLQDEAAVLRATDLALAWLHDRGYRNIIIEVCNEARERGYHHDILRLSVMPAMLQRMRAVEHNGWRFPVSVSLSGGEVPTTEIVAASDVILIHGNNKGTVVTTPARIREMIAQTRALPGFRSMPVVINEDDHYAFDQPDNNFIAATENHVSWGFFDFRRAGEPMTDGFQSVPVDWTISSPRKRAFFDLLESIVQR
jgi:hypothetical protein